MGIEIVEKIPESPAYFNLFETTGWNNEYKAGERELYKGISNSWIAFSAYENNQKLIGFGRVISDEVLYATICDVIIDPAYQKQGLGSLIVKKLIQRCKESQIRVVWLSAATGKSIFYKKFGFKDRPQNAPGMQLNLFNCSS